MDLPQFLRTATLGAGAPPRAPAALLYIPPSGRAVHCPSVEEASNAAELYAGEKPGATVAVYQLVGYAFRPVESPEFTPVDSDKARAELLPPKPDTLHSDAPAEGYDFQPHRTDLTPQQQGALGRLRDVAEQDEGQ